MKLVEIMNSLEFYHKNLLNKQIQSIVSKKFVFVSDPDCLLGRKLHLLRSELLL